MLILSSDVSEAFVLTINGEAANVGAGEISDEEARLAADMFMNTSVIGYHASVDKSEANCPSVAEMTTERLYCQTDRFAFLPDVRPHFQKEFCLYL